MEYAEWDFKLSIPDKDGVALRTYLEDVERQTGHTPLPLQGPDFPSLMEHVWSAFLSLHRARTMVYSGPQPITYSEIVAWQTLTGEQMSPWEIDVIKRLDMKYMEIVNDRPD